MSDGHLGEETKSYSPAPPAARRGLGCAFLLWLLAGLVIGCLATLLFFRWKYADPLPELTPAEFYAAREKWQQHEPADYDIEVQVSGTRAATYRVQVRGGEAIAASLNNLPLKQQRIFGTWSVRGMFGTISRDIEHLERRAAGKADQNTPRLTLRAQFDPATGYPARYRRIEWGSPVEVAWEVKRLEVFSAKSAARKTPPE